MEMQDTQHGKQVGTDLKIKMNAQDLQMTSSVVSASSSLTSPVDSGVQLLDSESEITSVMSVSGIGCDIDAIPNLESDEVSIGNEENSKDVTCNLQLAPEKIFCSAAIPVINLKNIIGKQEDDASVVLTKSDIVNQNIAYKTVNNFSASVPNSILDKLFQETVGFSLNATTNIKNKFVYEKSLSDEVFEQDSPTPVTEKKTVNNKGGEDFINISLNSYELLDYTDQNSKKDLIPTGKIDPMHISMSEEVSECLKVSSSEIKEVSGLQNSTDEQIVFRRQRKKKSKSDTPKKRVSFHEDILNSTKIDDIHINHGFITHENDVSISFFQNGFIRKPDVIKGRYSWAAEGDAPYYQKQIPERQIKSDIYVHHPRYSSTSSSSSASISSSIDEEEVVQFNDNAIKDLTVKKPKSSCLKKVERRKYVDTNIVEEIKERKKKSDLGLLDANIFGSLKNILNFSTSVPLAEQEVPKGQEDATVYSSLQDCCSTHQDTNITKNTQIKSETNKRNQNLNLDFTKTNLKLTKSEGFYPNYPVQNLPPNIVLCDSNVYEHKGISYSYEYDEFKKTFEQKNKPKSSTVYQMILKEFNFFRRKASQDLEKEATEVEAQVTVESKHENVADIEANLENQSTKRTINKYASSVKLDWSDTETLSDYMENSNPRHLNSPKHKLHTPNHYAVQPFKSESPDSKIYSETCKSLCSLRSCSSKTSLINRFLRNVTLKKILDMKVEKKQQFSQKYMSLCVKGGRVDDIDEARVQIEIGNEILQSKTNNNNDLENGKKLFCKIKSQIFKDENESLFRMYPVKSAYNANGEEKSLLVILSNTTLYITGFHAFTYYKHFVLPYTELNTVLIGPDSQTIHFSNYGTDMQCLITTGCMNITNELVGQLEIAIRKDVNKPKLPAVKKLNIRDMLNLKRAICKQTSVDKEEEYFYYSVLNMQDFNLDTSETPMGSLKEGPLMFRLSDRDTRWETAYFILKAGILYMLSSALHKVPMRVFPLIEGACQGARRIYHRSRPHTFQLDVAGTILFLAAPDEYVASEWLQALVHAASSTYNTPEKKVAQACSLLMTTDHILIAREALPSTNATLSNPHRPIVGPRILSCASILDITAFRLPSAEHSWCVLEFACREVHESSGDWILYFCTNTELERFISTLEMLWAYQNQQGECFPLSTIPETDILNKKCMDVYNTLHKPWLFLPIELN